MIEELSIVARARMHQINVHSGSALARRKPRQRPRQRIARATRWHGGRIVTFGRRFECYAANLRGNSHQRRPAKA